MDKQEFAFGFCSLSPCLLVIIEIGKMVGSIINYLMQLAPSSIKQMWKYFFCFYYVIFQIAVQAELTQTVDRWGWGHWLIPLFVTLSGFYMKRSEWGYSSEWCNNCIYTTTKIKWHVKIDQIAFNLSAVYVNENECTQ